MARSKTRILEVDQEDYGKYIKAQIELGNGEVVIADFKAAVIRGYLLRMGFGLGFA